MTGDKTPAITAPDVSGPINWVSDKAHEIGEIGSAIGHAISSAVDTLGEIADKASHLGQKLSG